MAATKEDIARWVGKAKVEGCTHLIVVCDTFDHDDYPVYVKPNEDVKERVSYYNKVSMQRVMEVYDMSMSLDSQLKEHRAYHI